GAPGCVTWELILDGYSESSYSATPRFAAARLPWFLWFIEFCISKHDDRMFRIIWLAIMTKGLNMINSPFTKLWGGSSYSPTDYGDKK
ncbi:hypothetical protein QS504_24745, partial [Escherichia coli]|nr:hypothetical protein [Escherichia coli]